MSRLKFDFELMSIGKSKINRINFWLNKNIWEADNARAASRFEDCPNFGFARIAGRL